MNKPPGTNSLAEPDAPTTTPALDRRTVAALLVGAVIGAAAAISFMRPQQPASETVSELAPSKLPEAQRHDHLYTPIAVESLPGWQEESIAEALPALHRSCDRLKAQAPDRVIGSGDIARAASAWHTACDAILRTTGGGYAALRAVLSDMFAAYRVASGSGETVNDRGLFTGYYEAELRGALEQGGMFQYPIYGVPRDLVTVDFRDFPNANLPAGVPSNIVGRVVDGGRSMRLSPDEHARRDRQRPRHRKLSRCSGLGRRSRRGPCSSHPRVGPRNAS